MSRESKFKKSVSSLIRSDIIFPDRATGEKFIGMTLKSWLNLHNEEKILEIYERLNQKIKEFFPISVNKAVDGLVKASKTFGSKNLWNGKRKQSKQRFALKLFYKIAFQEYNHIYLTLSPAVAIQENEKLFEEEFWKALDNNFTAPFWFILIGYGVLTPFSDISRPRKDYCEGRVDLTKYISLLDDIIKYWPVVGSLSSFHEIEIYRSRIESLLEEDDYVSPLTLISQLQNLCDLVEIRSSPENLTVSNENASVLIPEGIWIDEYDMGKTRFWIFPLNLRMIFCFSFEYGIWQLKVFEAISDYDDENDEYDLTVISPEESKNALLDGKLSSESIHETRVSYSDQCGEYMEKLIFNHLNHRPEWFDFSCMMRLGPSSDLHTRFGGIINELYNSKTFGFEPPLINKSAWMTDASNSFVAMDDRYIYLKDKGRMSHRLTIVENLEGEYYHYVPIHNNQGLSILKIDVTEESPLYIIPRNESDYPEMGSQDEIKKMIDSHIEITETPGADEYNDYAYLLRREAETYRRYKEAVFSTVFPGQITIYTLCDNGTEYKRLCFNKCGVAVDLQKAISLYGMKKVTSLTTL